MTLDTFCIVPWVHLRLGQDGETYPCCRMNEFYPYGSVTRQSIEEIWNSEPIRKLRLQMLSGKKLPLCEDCYACERKGALSLRQKMNSDFSRASERVTHTGADGRVPFAGLLSLDLRLSNVCNLRCRSCGPQNSTAWYGDAKKLGSSVPDQILRFPGGEDGIRGMLDAHLSTLKLIYFAGGEPLLEELHYFILERLIACGRTDIELDYNTNFSVLGRKQWNAPSMWRQFDKVTVSASLDGVGEQAEFIRKGLVWRDVEVNFKRLKTEAPRTSFYVYSTVSAMNAFHITVAIDKFQELGMLSSPQAFTLNVVTSPDYLRLSLFNETERASLHRHYTNYVKIAKIRHGTEFSEHIAKEFAKVLEQVDSEFDPTVRIRFRSYMLTLDRIRAERSFMVFPDLADIILN